MGVDYGARFGFGVQVTSDHEDFIEDSYSFLENLTYGTSFSYFVSGSYYEHNGLEYYITSDNAENSLDKQQYNLEYYAQELLDFLALKPELKVIGHPNIVGGLLIS